MPLPVRPDPPQIDVVCRGTPVERGAAQGSALQEAIRGCADAIYALEAFQLQRPWWLPMGWFVKLAESKAAAALRRGVARELPDVWARLEAIHATSGVSLGRLALLNAMEPVLSDIGRTVVTGVEAACSAVAAAHEQTDGHGPIVAHNFDYLPLVQPFYIVRDERPANGLRSLQFTAAPLAGAIDGINEAGLAVTLNYAFTTDLGRPAPTLTMRLAQVLAECRTVDEAIRLLTTRPRWGSGLIMLADASGARASLELSSTRHAVRRGEPGRLLSHANRFRSQETSDIQISADAVHGPAAPGPLRGRRVHSSSECREACLSNADESTGPLDPAGVARLMSSHGPSGVPSSETVCMHGDYWHTTACIQLLPQSRRMRIAYAPACVARYVELNLD